MSLLGPTVGDLGPSVSHEATRVGRFLHHSRASGTANEQLMELLPKFIPSVKSIVFQVRAGVRGGLQITAPDLWDTIMGLACMCDLSGH